jgi:hypothetical protein
MNADSASVELSTRCKGNGEAFVQVHRFALRQVGNVWFVIRRELSFDRSLKLAPTDPPHNGWPQRSRRRGEVTAP